MASLYALTNSVLKICIWISLLSTIGCIVWWFYQGTAVVHTESDMWSPFVYGVNSILVFAGFAATLRILELLERIAIACEAE